MRVELVMADSQTASSYRLLCGFSMAQRVTKSFSFFCLLENSQSCVHAHLSTCCSWFYIFSKMIKMCLSDGINQSKYTRRWLTGSLVSSMLSCLQAERPHVPAACLLGQDSVCPCRLGLRSPICTQLNCYNM